MPRIIGFAGILGNARNCFKVLCISENVLFINGFDSVGQKEELKMGFMSDRRGISPLMATILLIMMSIGMGVAVMSWGEDYIEEKAEFVQGVQETVTSCDVTSFSIIQIGGVPQFCQEETTLKGLVDNGPDADIADFHARVIGSAGIYVQESVLEKPVPRASATPVAFSTGDIGAVQQVKLTPKLLIGGQSVVCSRQALSIESIRPC